MTTIGTALQTAASTASPLRYARQADFSKIRAPNTPEEATKLREWALRQGQRWAPVSGASLTRHLGFMQATLPSRKNDEESGQLKASAYVAILGSYSERAIEYLAQTACSTLKWFPTPKECLDILAGFTDAPTPSQYALTLCYRYAQATFEEYRVQLKQGTGTQDLIDSVPDQWKRIAVEQGLLRWTKDHGFIIRIPGSVPAQIEDHRTSSEPRIPTPEDYRKMGIAVPDDFDPLSDGNQGD